MEKTTRCVLTFDTNLDTKRNMSISDPQPDLDTDTVVTASRRIIAANLHDTAVGVFRNLYRADIVTTGTTVLI